MPTDSTAAVVAFNAWAEHGGRHDFFKLLQPLPHARLLVRDPNQNGFNTGILGVGDSVSASILSGCPELSDAVNDLREQLGS